MDEEDEAAVLGQDVVLREKDILKELLKALPHKAQLGYSGLKEKFISSGDKSLKKIIAAAKTNDSLKVEYTCLDVTPKTIVLGCSLGIAFLYDRNTKILSRFVCEKKQIPIVSIKLLEERNFIATGQFSGTITIFQYGEEKNGLMKAILKCTVESHHTAPVTSILWTPDSMKLFTADSEGNVAITVINMDEGKTHTVFLCKEDSPVTQMSFSHTGLLISTLKRTIIWPFTTKKVVQVGMQERKVFGNFGACFLPPASQLPTDDHIEVFASRPGLRLWKATTDGKVLSTMIFKESIMKGEPIIETIDLSSQVDLPPQSEQKQFGSLIVFKEQFLVSWQGSCVWVIDPNTGYVIGCHSNLGCVVDVSACNNELFILSKGEEHFIRKIVFETVVPCIVVEDLDLNNPQEIAKAQGASSVSQFEDQDKLDKHIDEVVSIVKRGLIDVKSRVKGITEQIRSRDASEDDNSSPRAVNRNRDNVESVLSGEAFSTSDDNGKFDGTTSDENILSDGAGRPFESSNELLNSCEASPERKTETIEVEITHKTREKESMFGHLSKEEFPTNIVFEGTSIGKKKKKREKKTKKITNTEENVGTTEPTCDAATKDDDTVTLCDFDETTSSGMNRFQRVNSVLNKEISFDNDVNEDNLVQNNDVCKEDELKLTLNAETENLLDEQKQGDDVKMLCNNQNDRTEIYQSEVFPPQDEKEEVLYNDIENENDDLRVNSSPSDEKTIENETLHHFEKNIQNNTLLLTVASDTEQNNMLNEKSVDLLMRNDGVITTNSTPEFYYSLEQPQQDNKFSENDIAKHSPVVDFKKTDNVMIENDKLFAQDKTEFSAASNSNHISNEINNQLSPSVMLPTSGVSDISKTDNVTIENDKLIAQDKTEFSAALKSHHMSNEINNQPSLSVMLPTSDVLDISQTENKPSKKNNDDQEVNTISDNFTKSDENADTEISSNDKNLMDVKTHVTKASEEDMNIVNVKISHQRQGSNASVQSLGLAERCKEVRGEALERTHVRQPSGPILLGADDTLDSNIHPYDEDEISIDVRDDHIDLEGKLYPISPFPAPQVHSIYSQRSVSLSEFSLSNFDDKTEEEKLYKAIGEYDSIDVQADLIESIESITDVEDNLSNSPPSDVSMSDVKNSSGAIGIRRKKRPKNRLSYPNSPCSSDMEGRPLHSPKAMAESVQERLRYLADSWADVNLPSCGQIQYIACSDSVVWAIDNHDHVFCSGTFSQSYNWKKLDGKAMQVACNPRGSVVWCVDRNKVAYYRTGIKEQCQQGTSWEAFEKNIHYVAVDDDSVWAIKTNGDVVLRTGVSITKPLGTAWLTVKEASDLVQITCLDGLIWALDIYNHVQIFHGNSKELDVQTVDQSSHWCELPGITASHVILGTKGVCWIIDGESGLWFNQDITRENPLGGTWYQLSLGEHHSQDAGWFSSVLSYFTQGNEPKMIIANEVAGVLILGKQGYIHVAHGHLLGTRWETIVPSNVKEPAFWTCVAAGGMDMNKDYIWALQPNGQLYCFKPGGHAYNVHPPTKVVLKYCSAGPRSLWVLTGGPDVYLRIGISDSCPQGLKWLKVDMLAQGNRRLKDICCGNHVVWAVDFEGNAWFQMGRDERKGVGFAPAWVAVEGCPLDGSKFIKIVVGPDDRIVWACDDKNNVYARTDITENFWVGTSWEVVSGTSGKDLAISSNHVWGLSPNGDVMCRFGVSSSNVIGDYWKKVPGSFDKISVSANDDIWGIDRHGTLYQRQTLLFYGSTMSSKAPSYNDLFSAHDDWEFI